LTLLLVLLLLLLLVVARHQGVTGWPEGADVAT
jgi:hypothetical protein